MFLIGYFLHALAMVVSMALNAMIVLIVIRAVLSWVNPSPFNPIVRFIHNTTEPLIRQVRRRLPVNHAGVDFSPMIVILVMYFLQIFLVNSLERIAGGFL